MKSIGQVLGSGVRCTLHLSQMGGATGHVAVEVILLSGRGILAMENISISIKQAVQEEGGRKRMVDLKPAGVWSLVDLVLERLEGP